MSVRQRGPEVVGARSTCHGGRRAVPWIGRAAGDPGFEVGDHPVGQSHVRWHLQTVVAEGLEDQTLVDVARHDGWTGFTSTPDPIPRVECQAPFDFVRSRRVALVAVVDENRSDFDLKWAILAASRWSPRVGVASASAPATSIGMPRS